MWEHLGEKVPPLLGKHLLNNKEALIFTVNFYPVIAFNHCSVESRSQFFLILSKMRMLGRSTPFSWRSKRGRAKGPWSEPERVDVWQSPPSGIKLLRNALWLMMIFRSFFIMHIFQKCKTSHENVCFKSFSGFSLSIQCTPNFLCGLYDLVFAPLFKLLSPSSIRSDALDIPNYWQFPEQNLLSLASFLPLHGDTLLFSCLLAEMSSPVGTSP